MNKKESNNKKREHLIDIKLFEGYSYSHNIASQVGVNYGSKSLIAINCYDAKFKEFFIKYEIIFKGVTELVTLNFKEAVERYNTIRLKEH